MNQTRLESLIEVLFNILIGFFINFIANILILPMFGFNISATSAFSLGLVFTVISVARGYIIRRWFNELLHKAALRGAKKLS